MPIIGWIFIDYILQHVDKLTDMLPWNAYYRAYSLELQITLLHFLLTEMWSSPGKKTGYCWSDWCGRADCGTLPGDRWKCTCTYTLVHFHLSPGKVTHLMYQPLNVLTSEEREMATALGPLNFGVELKGSETVAISRSC